jgi:hypothetical protein
MMQRDTFNREGSERLRVKIRTYWAKRYMPVDVRLEPLEAIRTMDASGKESTIKGWVIRSNMVNGLPPKV